MVIGAVAGAIESSRIQPDESSFDVGRNAGANAVGALRPYIVLGSVCLAAAGTYFGLLPGTSKRRDKTSDSADHSRRSTGAMSDGQNNLSPKELAVYLGILVAAGVGIALQVAPPGIFSGIGTGLMFAVYYFIRRRPRDSG